MSALESVQWIGFYHAFYLSIMMLLARTLLTGMHMARWHNKNEYMEYEPSSK